MRFDQPPIQSPLEPRLAPPGAGIPIYQKLLLKLVVGPFISAKTPWEKSQRTFEKISEKIFQEVEGLSENELNQRVLVPPQTGLEDSSRYWSIKMTLEHLGIVGRKIFLVVSELSHGRTPQEKADIALLKPQGKMTALQTVQDFKNFTSNDFQQLNQNLGDRNSSAKFSHPWFGFMNAQQWYWLLGTHQIVHLKQIREIKKGLKKI